MRNFCVSVKQNHSYVMDCPSYKMRNFCLSVKQNHSYVMDCPELQNEKFLCISQAKS